MWVACAEFYDGRDCFRVELESEVAPAALDDLPKFVRVHSPELGLFKTALNGRVRISEFGACLGNADHHDLKWGTAIAQLLYKFCKAATIVGRGDCVGLVN